MQLRKKDRPYRPNKIKRKESLCQFCLGTSQVKQVVVKDRVYYVCKSPYCNFRFDTEQSKNPNNRRANKTKIILPSNNALARHFIKTNIWKFRDEKSNYRLSLVVEYTSKLHKMTVNAQDVYEQKSSKKPCTIATDIDIVYNNKRSQILHLMKELYKEHQPWRLDANVDYISLTFMQYRLFDDYPLNSRDNNNTEEIKLSLSNKLKRIEKAVRETSEYYTGVIIIDPQEYRDDLNEYISALIQKLAMITAKNNNKINEFNIIKTRGRIFSEDNLSGRRITQRGYELNAG